MSAEPLTFDDELPRRQWTRDKHGVLRMAPPRQRALQAELCEALAAVKAGQPLKVRREAPQSRTEALPEIQYSDEEMLAASAAYAQVRAGRLEALTEDQKGALRAHWALKARTRHRRVNPEQVWVRPTTGGATTAVEEIVDMVDAGMTLAAIAKQRGCMQRSVIKRLQEAGLRDIADELRAPSRPVRVVERVPGVQSKVAEEIARMAGEGRNC